MYNLPSSNSLNISALSGLFNNTTNSYKYLYFLSLLDILKRKNFQSSLFITFREIIIEMLANAWFPHNYFKLSFGKQDQIANKLDALNLDISKPILKFTDSDKKLLRETINNQNIDDIINYISRYVSYRLIRTFFTEETRGLKDYDVNPKIINLTNHQFDIKKPLYCFNSQEQKNCTAIILNDDWVKYLQENLNIVRGWASWEFLKYMQQKNPNVPNIVNKLFMPQKRDSLNKQTQYWKTILTHKEIKCIYSNITLDKNHISLDHYLPWSFVAHDLLWNLIPTTQAVNSSKSNNIPSLQYLDKFIQLQHLGLTVSHQNQDYLKKKTKISWEKYTESYVADLRINQADDLLNLDILANSYKQNVKSLISLATNQGFSANWLYSF